MYISGLKVCSRYHFIYILKSIVYLEKQLFVTHNFKKRNFTYYNFTDVDCKTLKIEDWRSFERLRRNTQLESASEIWSVTSCWMIYYCKFSKGDIECSHTTRPPSDTASFKYTKSCFVTSDYYVLCSEREIIKKFSCSNNINSSDFTWHCLNLLKDWRFSKLLSSWEDLTRNKMF